MTNDNDNTISLNPLLSSLYPRLVTDDSELGVLAPSELEAVERVVVWQSSEELDELGRANESVPAATPLSLARGGAVA
jgi:hypothetical protein